MAVNVDILNVNELYINGVNLLEGKRDYIQLVGDEKVVIDVPTGSTTYSKAIPQSGVNLGDVELKAIPLDSGTLDDINDGGGLGVDSTYKNVDSSGVSYFSNVNIDNFLINKVRTIKSVDYTTYKWTDVDYGNYSLALGCESLSEISSNGLVNTSTNSKQVTTFSATKDTTTYNVGTSSFYFNNNKIQISSSNDMILGTSDFTIESWVYINPTGVGKYRGIIQIGNESSQKFTVRINPSNNIQIYYAGGPNYLFDGYNIPSSVWTHITVVRVSGILNLYINGILIDSVNFSSSVNAVNPSYTLIGDDYNTGNNYYFVGNLDELSVSNIARYTSNFTPSTIPTLVDYNTILYLGNDSLSISSGNTTQLLSSTEKQFGTSSLQFNGTSYLTAPSNSKYVLGTDDFTIELGAKVTYLDANNGATLIENTPYNSSPTTYYRVAMSNTGKIIFQNGMSGGAIIGKTDQFNKWCNITVTRTNGVVTLYVNGIKEGESNIVVNFTRDTFDIGRNSTWSSNGALLQGFIDDLRITKGLARYTENFTPSADLMTGTRPVKHIVHSGTAIDSELKFSDYLVSYNAQIDPWVAVVPTITTTTSPFTLVETSALTSNTFTTTQSFNIGDVVSSDMETFGTVIFKEQDEYMVDTDIFYDGVQEKVLEKSDVTKINFVQDKRSGVYTNGLKDALLSATTSTIYGRINDEIIVDAGEGGHFNIGTMYTMGGYNDTDTTSQFNISVSDDGITYTVIYENLENLMTNHSHTMTGTGRFIKITFLNEIGTWGRIITNFVDGKWWDLSIVHPQSKVYTYSVKLEVNGKSIVPNYIEWFDNMTINKIVCGKVFINPTTVLNIKTENISKVELDLWKEVKGVL